MYKRQDNDYTYTAKGATTEIYVDDVNETVTVVMINYYLGEITKIKTDDDGEYATVRVLGKNQWTDPVDERDIYCTGFAEDEYVVITVDEDEDDDSFIASSADPKAVEGTVTYVAKASEPEDEAKGNYVKLDDGNKYNYSKYTEADVEDINTCLLYTSFSFFSRKATVSDTANRIASSKVTADAVK